MGGTAGKIVSNLNPVNAVKGIIQHPLQGIIGATGGSLLGGAAMGPAGALLGGSFGANSFSPPPGATNVVNPPFYLDPAQVTSDKAAINDLATQQYSDKLAAIDANQAAQTDAASKFFQSSLPNIAENAQAAHLYDSTGYGEEVARQQANIANQVASSSAAARLAALDPKQALQQSAVSRGFSLEDFINQANVAKAIGAAAAPQVGNGKGSTGALLSGVGATAPLVMAAKGLGKGAGAASAAGAGAGAADGLALAGLAA